MQRKIRLVRKEMDGEGSMAFRFAEPEDLTLHKTATNSCNGSPGGGACELADVLLAVDRQNAKDQS